MRALLLTVVLAAALALCPSAEAHTVVRCGHVTVHGTTFAVTVQTGHAKCTEARRTMATFLAGGGTEHGGKNAPDARKFWTLHGGWSCGFATEGGGCTRRHRPRATILAQAQAAPAARR